MGRVVHFEVMAEDTRRARQFYEGVFGWEIQKWDGPFDYWLVKTGAEGEPGIDGAIMERRSDDGPGAGAFVCTVSVSSLDESLRTVEQQGGEMISPKDSIPGVGSFAYCRDTEGNVFGMMQSEAEATTA